MRFNPLKPTAQTALEPEVSGATRPGKNKNKPSRKRGDGPIVAPPLATFTGPDGEPLATITANAEKSGIEIRFSVKPDDTTLQPLRDSWPQWKWSRFSSCWYAKDTPANRQWAVDFLKGAASGPCASTLDGVSRATRTETTEIVVAKLDQKHTTVAPPSENTPAAFQSPAARVVIFSQPPPGGWTEADRVPAHLQHPSDAARHLLSSRSAVLPRRSEDDDDDTSCENLSNDMKLPKIVVPQLPPMPGMSILGLTAQAPAKTKLPPRRPAFFKS